MKPRSIAFLLNFAVAAAAVSAFPSVSWAQKIPSPPLTDRYSVQMFQGDTQNCWIAVYPPNTYTDGTATADGTPVKINVYRSYDEGRTYGKRGVELESGGQGKVGQGEDTPRTKRWIDCKLKTPVDNKEPYAVWLAVSAVVGGQESAKINKYLTFRYVGKDGRPRLERYLTPDLSGEPVDDELARPLPQELPGIWSDGEFIVTTTWASDKVKDGSAEGCEPAMMAAMDQLKGKPLAMEVKFLEIDLVDAPMLDGRPLFTHKNVFAGRLALKIQSPQSTEPPDWQDPMSFAYHYKERMIVIDQPKDGNLVRMWAQFFQTGTHYSLHGVWKIKAVEEGSGKDLSWIRGTWSGKKRRAP